MEVFAVTAPWLDPVKHRDWWEPVDSPVRVTVVWDERWHLRRSLKDRRWVARVWTLENASASIHVDFFELFEGEPGFNTTSPVKALHLFTSCRFADKDEAEEWGKAACERLCDMRRTAAEQRGLREKETILVWRCDEGMVSAWERDPERSRR